MPSYFAYSTVDERCIWASARCLSLLNSGVLPRAVADFARTVQDGFVSFIGAPANQPTPAYMILSFLNLNVVLISGVPNLRTAVSFINDTARFAPATPLNGTAVVAGDVIMTALLEAYRQNPGRLLVVGFSYGGVIAQYLAPAFRDAVLNDDIRVITFGSPRPARRQFGPAYNGIETLRVSNAGDPIPFVVPWSSEDAIAYWSFRATLAFAEPNDWTHFGRGVRLNDTGFIWSEQMPAFPAGGIGTSVIGWATGLMAHPVGEHAIACYEARLSNMVPLPGAGDDGGHGVVFPPPGPPPGLPIPAPAPLPARERQPVPERVPAEPPPKPPGVRSGPTFYAASILTGPSRRKEWWVYHWDVPIFRAANKSNAKRSASRLNSVQLAWLGSTAGEQADLLDAIEAEFPN
jgi:pimeloyl-ACP methyl ester carboxylesterase